MKNNSILKEHILPVFIITFFIFLNTYTFSPKGISPNSYDHALFRYFGRLLLDGGNIMIDFVDLKFPILYYFAALGEFVGMDGWGFWIAKNILIVISLMLTFYATKRRFGKKNVIILLLTYSSVVCYFAVMYDSATRTILGALILSTMALYFLIKNFVMRYAVCGLVTGLVFMNVPSDIMGLFPLLCLVVYEESKQSKIKINFYLLRFSIFGISFLLLIASFLLRYYYIGNLDEIYLYNGILTTEFYGYKNISIFYRIIYSFRAILLTYPGVLALLPFTLLIFVPLFFLRKIGKLRYWIWYWVAIIAFCIQFISVSFPGQPRFNYYYVEFPFILLICFLTLYLIKKKSHSIESSKLLFFVKRQGID